MKCLICKSETKTINDLQFELNYFSCEKCGFIAQDRDSTVSFDEERVEYDRHENNIENEGYVNYFKKFIDKALIPYADLGVGLDFGSGPEPVFSQVMKRDYDAKMDIYDLHYQTEEVYQGKYYDYIVSTEVIEHVSNPLEFLTLLAKHLKPGGVIALMTLFHTCNDAAFLQWWYRRDITHISFFTPMTFRYMAQKLGLEIIYCDDLRYITLKNKINRD